MMDEEGKRTMPDELCENFSAIQEKTFLEV